MNIEHRTSNIEHRTGKVLREWLAVLAFLSVATLMIFHTPTARGDLTARVYPGYIFAAGERPDISKLNRLGTPTIVIVGTLSGTNVGLSAGSVTLTMLSADIYDNVTIDTTNGTSLRVKPSGITTLQLYTNMFSTSSALDPAGGTVKWNPDWNFLAISNNQATMRTSVVAAAILPLINTTTYIYSNQLALPAAAAAQSVNHGMGTTPSWWRVSLVCTNADLNYSAGDEVDLSAFVAWGQFGNDERTAPAFTAFIDPSGTPSIAVRRCASTIGSITVAPYTLNKTTGAFAAITTGSWNLRIRVRP